MDFRVLGPVEVALDGEVLALGGPKQRSVLALLVSRHPDPVSLEGIVHGVYGEDAPEGARHSVQTYISSIRRELGAIIDRRPGGYSLLIDAADIDANRFEEAVHRARADLESDPAAAADGLREALGMWRGHPYADVDGIGALQGEATRLSELRLAATEGRIDADLALGRHRELLAELEALTSEHPLRERFRAQQMLALYRAGRQTEALRAYTRTRSFLIDEIGIEPGPELRDLEHRILDHDASLDPPATTSLSERTVVVVDLADRTVLAGLTPDERAHLLSDTAEALAAAVGRHGGGGLLQRGSASYMSFPRIDNALAAVAELMVSDRRSGLRVAVDHGDVEVIDSGEATGPPVRRSAGIVVSAHAGQVLISTTAHHALAEQGGGWLVRALGLHPIHGVDRPEQLFQLVLDGQDDPFPPLLQGATPPPLPTERNALAGYELRQPVSSDLSGATYRAYQPSVGREVLVTVIDPVWANDASFVGRFEVETQLLAQLHHPAIAPVLDYWRDPTGAYLVGPVLEGRALPHVADALDRDDRVRLLTQVGGALEHAHRRGVVHGRLSPEVVLVSTSGEAHLSGTGFLSRLSRAPTGTESNRPPSIEGDTAAFSDLVGALLGEDTPVGAATIADLLVHLRGGSEEGTRSDARNPYKGLAAFGEADRGDFFGRAEAVELLAKALEAHKLVAVVGPSGAGKSSLVRAGLIPQLRSSDTEWVVADMYPGSYPFVELDSAIATVAVEAPPATADAAGRGSHGLVRALKGVLPTGARLLLVIDQFEELFTLTRDAATRDAFLEALTALALDERSDTRVVLTLRADFFDRPLQHPEFGALLQDGMVALTTPSDADLADAIREPASGVGVAWHDDAVEQVLSDVSDAPGALPLLQHALRDTFASRRTDEIDVETYRSIGGVVGALGRRADGVFESLSEAARQATEQVFLELVVARGGGIATRRRVRVVDLSAVADPASVQQVLSVFGDARLITFDRDPITRGPTVEVAHEALISGWDRLAGWVRDAEDDLLQRQRLEDAVAEWEGNGRSSEFLLSGGPLTQFIAWSERPGVTVSTRSRDYLNASEERAQTERRRRTRARRLSVAVLGVAAVVSALAALFAWSSQSDAVASADIAHSRELTASAINVLEDDPELSLLLAIEASTESAPTVASLSALREAIAAQRISYTYNWPPEQPLSQELLVDLSPDGGELVASGGTPFIEVVDLSTGSRTWSKDFGGSGIARAWFTPDAEAVVVTYGWAATSELPEMDEATAQLLGVHVLDAGTGDVLRSFEVGACGVVTQVSSAKVVGPIDRPVLLTGISDDPTCSYSGARVQTVVPDSPPNPHTFTIDLTDGRTRQLSEVQPAPDTPVPAATISDDGRLALVAIGHDPQETRILDMETGNEITVVPGWPSAISGDGSVAATHQWGMTRTWDLSAEPPLEPLFEDQTTGTYTFSMDGSVLAEPDRASLRLWDPWTGETVTKIPTNLGSHGVISFDLLGTRLAISEVYGPKAIVVDLEPKAEVAAVPICPEHGNGYIDPLGDLVGVRAFCDQQPTQFFFDADTWEPVSSIWPSGGLRGAFSSDGSLFADQYSDGEALFGNLEIHDPATGDVLATFEGMCEHNFGEGDCAPFPESPFADWAADLDFSPDGSLLAMAGDNSDGFVVWDTSSGQIEAIATAEHKAIGPERSRDVEFSPDGSRMVGSFIWAPKELWMWSTEDWQTVASADNELGEPVADNLIFTPDGALLIGTDVAETGTGLIAFLDGEDLSVVGEIEGAHDGGINQLAVSPDGTLLASAGWDGFARVWDIATRTLVQEIPVSNAEDPLVGGVAFVNEGRHLAVSRNATGQVVVFTLDPDELMEIARDRLSRGLTETECAAYAVDPCPGLREVLG